MRNGNAVAIALAGLAVVIAGAGTAVAVTTKMTISDPKYPTHVARVDGAGRLTTTAPTTTINALAYDYPSQSDFVQPILSPTKATIAITEIVYDNSVNISQPDNNLTVSLVKITPGSAGHCYDNDAKWTVLRRDGVRQGDSMSASLTSPLAVAPTGSAKYCIGTVTRFAAGSATSSFPLSVTIGAYVVSGAYSGAGLPKATATRATPKLHVNR